MIKKKKKKSISSHRKAKKKKKIRASEIVAVLLVFLALFIFISLISYDSRDPSWANATPSHQKTHNYAGRVGASFSEALLQFLGFSAFLIPLALIYLGYAMFFPGRRLLLKSLGSFLFIILFGALLFMCFDRFAWRGTEIQAGGIMGSLVSSIMVRNLNSVGTILILISLLVLLLILFTQVSLKNIFGFLSRLFQFFFKEIRIKITRYRKDKQREKMRRRVVEKYSPPDELGKEKKAPRKKRKILPEERVKPEPVTVKPPKQPPAEKLLFPELEKKGDYEFPPYTLLDPGKPQEKIDKDELFDKKQCIEEKLREFRVEGQVREYHPGPVITTFEFYPHPGIKVSQVANLSEDLSLALGAESVRIQRIPGKSTLGVEVPNNKREIIKVRDILQSEKFYRAPSKLAFALGKTIHGEVYITDLSVMPHLLIAGATGTGKSVALNSLITSILYKATPEEVKLILIDPKRLEFSIYDGIPHLLCPVVRDPKKAGSILLDTIKKMEDRYQKLGLLRVRNIEQYNKRVKMILKEKKGQLTDEEKANLKFLPYLVIIIDELAELMMIGAQEVEYYIARLAQLARAVGIHLVMATQRPSIDVITGTIKNNFSSRIAFRVPSKVDSRIIIDSAGAEKLLGLGDMLFMPPNYPRLIRLHCSYVSLPEITRLVRYVKQQAKPSYDNKIIEVLKRTATQTEEELGEKDTLYLKALELILLTGQASASYLQRKLKLGYARAARIIDQMEQEGILGPSEGSKPREILVDPRSYLKKMNEEK
jgi:S-DNA-T family DNA segregation ATPase FtsK/SpoIIIE